MISRNSRDNLYTGSTGEYAPNKSVYFKMTQKFGVLFANTELKLQQGQPQEFSTACETETTMGGMHTTTQSLADSPLTKVRREAETMAKDLILTFGAENAGKPPNKYCKTLRRTVTELSTRHVMVFKGIVKKLNPAEENALQTFVTVADELFGEGQVNWGRVVAVYAFAAHLTKHLMRDIETGEKDNKSRDSFKEVIAQFVGTYVANKLGQWIVDNGGWNAFVEYFPDPAEFEDKLWTYGLMTTLGLGALATLFATR
ncbi:hypothetical protein BsWGS_04721 [Bradybaena similaris]